MTYTVAALYRFTPIPDTGALRATLKDAFTRLEICGTLLVASEGINGTLAAPSTQAIDEMLALLAQHTGLSRDEVKFSEAPEKPFNRLKIRLKREIITFKQPQADVNTLCGEYVEARDWNALIADPEVVVLDARNAYETCVGVFDRALDPNIEQFTDFASYVRENLDPTKHKKVAMYCTGGIRCEKASAFMRAEGFENVYHLKGGILKYLEEVPAEESKWQGECYVFDRRVAVGHGLTTGRYTMCFCCGHPLAAEDRANPHYEEGVSCERCFGASSDDDKARFRMRQKQLAA
ncbi:MAG TPA: rhodanese-related sulfurtransferase [Alphaproteobacteria bacterium]|nr:rhodanese-related sulfurtransferase [Alphaproteobacteria bacterium]